MENDKNIKMITVEKGITIIGDVKRHDDEYHIYNSLACIFHKVSDSSVAVVLSKYMYGADTREPIIIEKSKCISMVKPNEKLLEQYFLEIEEMAKEEDDNIDDEEIIPEDVADTLFGEIDGMSENLSEAEMDEVKKAIFYKLTMNPIIH